MRRTLPGMQEIVALMAKDAPLDSERDAPAGVLPVRLAAVRATPDADYTEQMRKLLDYRLWWRFTISFSRGPDTAVGDAYQQGARLAVRRRESSLPAPAPVRRRRVLLRLGRGTCGRTRTGGTEPGSPRLILLDEVFAGVDEDNRGDLFELIRILDLDLVATSESEQGFYRQLDGLADLPPRRQR